MQKKDFQQEVLNYNFFLLSFNINQNKASISKGAIINKIYHILEKSNNKSIDKAILMGTVVITPVTATNDTLFLSHNNEKTKNIINEIGTAYKKINQWWLSWPRKIKNTAKIEVAISQTKPIDNIIINLLWNLVYIGKFFFFL